MTNRARGGLAEAARLGAGRLARAGIRHLPLRAQLFSLARSLHLPRSLYRRLPIRGPFRVTAGGDASFRLVGHELPTETELFWGGLDGYDERESLRCWMRICRNASVVMDVGASIGVYSLAAAAVNPKSLVFGFEPLGHSYDFFRANCSLNGFNIQAIRAAVGDQDGTAEVFCANDPMMASLARTDGVEPERVPMVTLKSFLAERGLDRLEALKVDVESFEPAVFAGMGDALARFHPSVIVEVLNDAVGEEIERRCSGLYDFFHIDERRGPVRSEHVRRVSHDSRNYLLCTRSIARTLGLA
jgi:FkbM family methyltransferase